MSLEGSPIHFSLTPSVIFDAGLDICVLITVSLEDDQPISLDSVLPPFKVKEEEEIGKSNSISLFLMKQVAPVWGAGMLTRP